MLANVLTISTPTALNPKLLYPILHPDYIQSSNNNAGFRKLASGSQDLQRSMMSSTSRIVRRDSSGLSSNNNIDDLDDNSLIEL
ncbi:hypothetical protein DPV78_012346 [Talaromyces pinophilus]|nr:hypothetical protein DPV78_012346 [Talaromyces pinophilus]